MNDHAGRESACRQEMGNNEFSRSGLIHPVAALVLDWVNDPPVQAVRLISVTY